MTCEEFGLLCAGIPNNRVGIPECFRKQKCLIPPLGSRELATSEKPITAAFSPNYLFNLEVKSYFVRPVAYERDWRHKRFASFSIQTTYVPRIADFGVYLRGPS